MKPSESRFASAAPVSEPTLESVAEAAERARILREPALGMRERRVSWLRPEEAAPRAVAGDDEPLAEEIEL